MLAVRKSNDRGHANHGWLDSKFTFSFADYHDPEFMGFRALRVINEDVIQGGGGFGTHGHREMEIVTYVLQIWLLPSKSGVTPSYSQQSFPIAAERNLLHLVASPEGRNNSLAWVTDADLYAARLDAGAKIEHAFGAYKYGWVQVARGSAVVNGKALSQGDGLALSEEAEVSIQAGKDGAEVLFFQLG